MYIQDWRKWWDNMTSFPRNLHLHLRPIIPSGNSKPNEYWGGKMPIEIKGSKRTIDKWCKNPSSKECCYVGLYVKNIHYSDVFQNVEINKLCGVGLSFLYHVVLLHAFLYP